MQSTIDFHTQSPVNIDRIKGQNRRLYDYLRGGGKIHCFHHSVRDLRIGYLNSRISDLIHLAGIAIHKRWVQVKDLEGNVVSVKEYSL